MADGSISRLRPALTRERVLAAAIALADGGGIEALSMRRLAKELGVEAMSLYNHVANKGDLVDAMVELVVDEIELPATGEWDAAIRECAISAHAAFLRHPWACSLVIAPTSSRRPRATRLRYMEWLLGRLRDAGLSPELTYSAYHTLDAHIVGFSLWQLGHSAATAGLGADALADLAERYLREFRASGYPRLAEHLEQHVAAPDDDGDREFAFGLDLIMEGLERLRAAEAGPRQP